VNGTAAADSIQPGVYFRAGEEQPVCFGLLLLDFVESTAPPDARSALAELWMMLSELRDAGVVRDLRPQRDGDPDVRVERQGLTTLLGYGSRLWDERRHLPPLVRRELRPWELTTLRPGAGRPFPKLHWAPDAELRPGQADVAVQVIAEREVTITRVVVETAKLLADEALPMRIVAFHRGFRRDDGRSWTDFGDGTNNMSASERRLALEVISPDPPWMRHGTYMAFLRLAIDLTAWRALSRSHQEIVVGRQKLTGCPIERIDRDPAGLVPVARAPCPPPEDATPAELAAHVDPPPTADPLVQASHIHRSNRSRGGPDTDANNRVYRQGYEFMEILPDGALHLGLNFVSFQRALSRVQDILHKQGWQGDSNFGGPEPPGPGEPGIELMRIVAGGYYAVPPSGDPFPGADLF
jgi:Dyp-type peroxidase family